LLRFSLVLIIFAGLNASSHATNNEIVAAALKDLFASGEVDTGSENVNMRIDAVEAYYATRSYKPVWTRDDGPKSKGKALLEELKTSLVHGLTPQNYNVEAIAGLMDSSDPADQARLDLLLSGAVVEFGNDLRNGRLGAETPQAYNGVKPVILEPARYIEGAADAGNFRQLATGFLNADERYVRMIAKLTEMQRIQAAGLWPAIDTGKSVDEQREEITNLLAIAGDLPRSREATPDDAQFAEAVRKFQQRHGLSPTGEINGETFAEMAVSAETRSDQILLNLERRRWQNRIFADNHIYINLADNTARIVLGGETSHFTDVVETAGLDTIPTVFGAIREIEQSDGQTRLSVAPDYAALNPHWPEQIELTLTGSVPDIANMQIFITYITAWVSSDGQLHFRRDPFDRDGALLQLLEL
jgi:L,D-transpeptidase YcbB